MTRTILLGYSQRIGLAIFIVLVGWLLTFLVGKTIERVILREQGDNNYTQRISMIVRQIVSIVMMVFVLLFAVQSVGVNVALLIGGLTFAIGYAMQETLGNLMAGLLLLSNPKYKLGLLMEFLGDINTFGTLESITLRNSVIRGFDKQATIVPNMKLLSTPMKTFKIEGIVRYKITIAIQRTSDIHKIKELLTEVVNAHEYVIQKEHTSVMIESFVQQGTLLAIYFFFNPQCGYSSFKTRSEIRSSIHTALQAHGITIPFPRRLLETSKLQK